MDLLKDIKKDLRKEENNCLCARIVYVAQQAGQVTRELWTKHNKNQNIIEDRLRHIKNAIKL